VKNEVLDVDFFSSFAVSLLPNDATLEEKREVYIESIYQYDIQENEYLFFAMDLEGNSFLSGLTKNLEGTNISYLQDAITGNYFVLDMIDIIENSDTNDGYITYYWMKVPGGDHIKKTSYIYYNSEVDLFIGTGLYEIDYIAEVQEELFSRISTYEYNLDDYVYIMGFDGEVIYHPSSLFTTQDLLDIDLTNGQPFHETIVEELNSNTNTYVDYYFEFDNLNQYKTGYISKIDGWDMYIGKSFVADYLTIERSEYISDILPGVIMYNISITLMIIFSAYLIRNLFTRNFSDINYVFDEKNKLIKKTAFIDHLTGLHNRSYFDELMNSLSSCKKDIGVVMLDANGLKLVNDAYGHSVGDKLLKELSKILTSVYHDSTVFRWGGDEFLVVMQDSSEQELINRENLFDELANQVFIENVQLSASSGFYIAKICEEDIDRMINKAEKIMYEKKTKESAKAKRTIIDNILQTLYNSFNFEELHSENVMKYSMMIGEHIGLDKNEKNSLRLAALLHDIGKIGIPDNILVKEEALTAEEFYEIKLHPEKGYRILSAYPELSEYGKYILCHHERFDGTGYPRGLKNEEIPLLSRIITVADAYDAMRENRVYKKSLTKEEAIDELIRCRGTQFDPEIVDAFIGLINKTESK
jgi:diguanylate cyclase (GGDEF)-like protein